MVEIYFRKVKYTFNTLGIFFCGLGYLWFVYELFARDFLDMRQKSGNDAIFYFIIAVVIFGALLLLYLNWIYLRQFVKCIILHRPALVLAMTLLWEIILCFPGHKSRLSSLLNSKVGPPIMLCSRITMSFINSYLACYVATSCGLII